MRVAAVDCGTNTFRLLVASRAADGALVEHDRRLSYVRLGQGVDSSREFHPDALARADAALAEFAEVIKALDVERVRVVATSATRDAHNRATFFASVRNHLGVEAEVISGDEEAQLSFTGAMSGGCAGGDPVLVVDSGGGSTELIRGRLDGTIDAAVSIDLGSRRVRERYFADDPPTPAQIEAARTVIQAALADRNLADIATFIGVAGTMTTMSALAQRLEVYDRDKVHGSTISRERVAEVTNQLLAMTSDEIVAMGPVPPERAQVLSAGALIVNEIAQQVGTDVFTVSEADLLDGVVLALLGPNLD